MGMKGRYSDPILNLVRVGKLDADRIVRQQLPEQAKFHAVAAAVDGETRFVVWVGLTGEDLYSKVFLVIEDAGNLEDIQALIDQLL